MLRRVRVRTLNLHEALGADSLVAAPRLVEVWWVVYEADRTLRSIFVQKCFHTQAVYVRIDRELDLAGNYVALRWVFRR